MQSANVRGNPCNFLKAVDMYGQGATFTFQGQLGHNSWIGTCFTVLALGLFMAFSLVRTQKLISGDDPFLSMVTLPSINQNGIDVFEMQYGFAIQNIDKSMGMIYAHHVKWGTNRTKEYSQIEMVDCNSVNGQVGKLKIFDAVNDNGELKFLCPILTPGLELRGKFGDDIFDYITVKIHGCNLGN